MKAYKIVSKEPIIENSLVKIVMAPQNVLDKLSKHERSNVKYSIDEIDKSGNAPIKNYSIDDGFGRELIQNGNGNVNVEVFSLEEDGNAGFMDTTQLNKNVLHHEANNIQVIAKSHKQPLNSISMDPENLFDLKGKTEVTNDAINSRDEVEGVNNMQLSDVNMEPTVTNSPASTTEATVIDSTYSEAEELLSNPTTAKQLLQTSTPEHMKSELSEEDKVSTEINSSTHPTSLEDLGNSQMASVELSTENNVPLVILKILKNRTVLVEETDPTRSDQLSTDTTFIPKLLPPVRPKIITRPSTTTKAPITAGTKPSQFPKKAQQVDPYSKYKNAATKLDDISFEVTPKTSLLDVETTHPPPLSDDMVKSKNIKRAVGDEGTFSNIVRPSPIRPKKIGDLLPRETEPERTERLNKSLQRLMHFVTIVGHVDSYMTKRFRNGLKNVARIFDSIEDTRRRRSNF